MYYSTHGWGMSCTTLRTAGVCHILLYARLGYVIYYSTYGWGMSYTTLRTAGDQQGKEPSSMPKEQQAHKPGEGARYEYRMELEEAHCTHERNMSNIMQCPAPKRFNHRNRVTRPTPRLVR
ncbi:hypothetical protein NDU88_000061 [Pleurodeles waltl]|uniref:Uncharacterized protein n=1 Tax=Pleurodeles waltl TaxID=8319 RepID=A0AAV7N6V9_PLEWA|nr:hypothetical protein NDU88_000061 [Pleurodeles waltl]